MADPLIPQIDTGRMAGRGSYDMKGGVAAILAAAAEIAASPRLPGDLYIAAVADEEHASIGTEAILAHMAANGLHADFGIVAEPTEYELIVAHKGFVWATISTQGHAAHGSAWEQGIDAIVRMGRVLVALEQLDQDLHVRPAHALLGVPSLHAALISGGSELSTYPAHCELQIERRTLPGESIAQIWSEFDQILSELRASDPRFRAELALGLTRPPMQAGLDTPLVRALQTAAEARLGQPISLAGVAYWTDAALMANAGIPSVLFGPCGAGAHADQEWVDLASVEACAAIYAEVIRAICGASI
jgi:acetylornithine deacetylase